MRDLLCAIKLLEKEFNRLNSKVNKDDNDYRMLSETERELILLTHLQNKTMSSINVNITEYERYLGTTTTGI